MKNCALILILMFLVTATSSCDNKQKGNQNLVFETKTLVSDTVSEEVGLIDFYFKYSNEGQYPIYLVSAEGTCYCTQAEFSEEGLMPGNSDVLHVTYNTIARPGEFDKPVIITYHYNDSTMVDTVTVKGYVTPIDLE